MMRLLASALAIVFLYGCAHVISKEVLQEVNAEITFAELRKAPQAYKGKVLLLGGVIVKTLNKKDGTLLEVYQTETDREGRPIELDESGGRFLAHHKGILDSEIYRKGRKVTIAGMVQGEKILKLGEIDYHYPYLLVKDIYLWKEAKLRHYDPYPWGFWDPWFSYPGYPWHPWYPWYDPYWHHRHYRH